MDKINYNNTIEKKNKKGLVILWDFIYWIIIVACIIVAFMNWPSSISYIFWGIGLTAFVINIIRRNTWERLRARRRRHKIFSGIASIIFLIVLIIAIGVLSSCASNENIAQRVDTDSNITTATENDQQNNGNENESVDVDSNKESDDYVTPLVCPPTYTPAITLVPTYGPTDSPAPTITPIPTKEASSINFNIKSIPYYSGSPFVVVNDNNPFFNESDLKNATRSFETYSELDNRDRCGMCIASVGRDIMPTEERGEIGAVKPSGWKQAKYNGLVDGNYLYNRCHLIGYQLTGENANTKNLITGTRYLNVDGMLPFENMVADFVKETGYHVLYRVTPIFENDNLLSSGVLMEAESIEDNGEGILFCVYCYNVQPGVMIDYTDGSSELASVNVVTATPTPEVVLNEYHYAVNTKNGKIHIIGECAATGHGASAMTDPAYFNTYEEAEAYSIQIAPNLSKRKCGNCW